MVTHKKKNGEKLEYIFSSELRQAQKETLKRDREINEELAILGKKIKFQEVFGKESKCLICEKMIYECVSVVPCLHSFCMICFMRHLQSSQDCPECDERFVEFRKNVFLNNLIEGYEESGYQRRDRSPEECVKINEKLNTKRIIARFEYANEDLYEDEWKRCKRDGRGKLVNCDGNSYEGDWRNGNMEGKGKTILENGHIYEGDFKGDKLEGKGKMTYANGEIYEGEFKANKKEGKGRYIFHHGCFYKGDFKANQREGKGKMRYGDGGFYKGEWKDDEKEGQGKYFFKNGDVYEGDFKGDLLDGRGNMKYLDGSLYEGHWRNNMREGKGRMIYTDGRIYEGEWRNHFLERSRRIELSDLSVNEEKLGNHKIQRKRKKRDKAKDFYKRILKRRAPKKTDLNFRRKINKIFFFFKI